MTAPRNDHMTTAELYAVYKAAKAAMPLLPLLDALRLVREWAYDAAIDPTWLDRADLDVELRALAWQDDGKRAHLRCAAQLLRCCVSASGKQPAELLADLATVDNPGDPGDLRSKGAQA